MLRLNFYSDSISSMSNLFFIPFCINFFVVRHFVKRFIIASTQPSLLNS